MNSLQQMPRTIGAPDLAGARAALVDSGHRCACSRRDLQRALADVERDYLAWSHRAFGDACPSRVLSALARFRIFLPEDAAMLSGVPDRLLSRWPGLDQASVLCLRTFIPFAGESRKNIAWLEMAGLKTYWPTAAQARALGLLRVTRVECDAAA